MTVNKVHPWPTLEDGRVLVLRTNPPDGTTYNNFQWSHTVGDTVTAPDWDPDPEHRYGGGLHGLIWGCGAEYLLYDPASQSTVWMVVAVHPRDIAAPPSTTPTPEAIRFRSCEIMYCEANRDAAIAYLCDRLPEQIMLPIVYGSRTVGHNKIVVVGNYGTAQAGINSKAIAGYSGTATVGNYGVAVVAHYGTAIAGDYGTAIAGCNGVAAAGYGGMLVIDILDKAHIPRVMTRRCVEVDGVKIKTNTLYQLNHEGEFVEVDATRGAVK